MIEGQEGVTWAQWVALARGLRGARRPGAVSLRPLPRARRRAPRARRARCWTTLAALGAVTTRLRLGTLVSPATFRHPSVLAKAVATADHVSDGRVELGLGPAGMRASTRPTGSRSRRRASGWTSWRSSCRCPGLVGGRARQPRGPALHAADLDAQPKPVQRPHPPILLGGGAGPRAPRSPRATPTSTTRCSRRPPRSASAVAVVERACEAAGREPLPFSLMTGVLLGRDRAELEDRARPSERGDRRRRKDRSWPSRRQGGSSGPSSRPPRTSSRCATRACTGSCASSSLHDDLDAVALLGRELPALL